MDMDLINVIIYVCASLGGVLLLLCIILASFFLYSFCKKHFCPGISHREYVIVPTEHTATNGQIVLKKFSSEDLAKSGLFPRDSISFEDESDAKNHQIIKNKNVPPVKKKMLWKQKKKSYQQKSIIFDNNEENNPEEIQFKDEELNVPKERLFKSQLKAKRKSKSEWDLHDTIVDDVSENLEKFVEIQKSQYFDALDTIDENEEEESDNDMDELDEAATLIPDQDAWEDIIDAEENIKTSNSKHNNKKSHKKKSNTNPPEIKKRINALRVLQLKQKILEAKFYMELYDLEAFHNIKPKDPVFDKRCKTINDTDDHGDTGIEGFWLQAMDNCEALRTIVQIHDRPILKKLKDIRVITSPLFMTTEEKTNSGNMGFRIEFHFSPNEYFQNDVLYKDYALRCEPDLASPWTFDGPEVCNCKGSKISWKKGKNATLRPVRKIRDGQIVTKWAKRNSFFNFFTPPKLTRDALMDPSNRTLFEAHFQIGLYLKETFIPQAIKFYINYSKCHKIRHNSDHQIKSTKPATALSNMIKPSTTTSTLPSTSSQHKNDILIQNGHAMKHEAVIENSSKPEEDTKEDTKSAIIEVLPPPAADPIAGRYRLLKTENFDEFMKKLGVGLVKRKLANSVSPVNVIIVNEDGSYTVRTETTVRTTELNFHLGIPFKEETLDGRTTDTTATRNGNVLTLDQQGDPKKGEMNTLHIRDFQGDKMLMSLVAEDVVCLRYYEKMREE